MGVRVHNATGLIESHVPILIITRFHAIQRTEISPRVCAGRPRRDRCDGGEHGLCRLFVRQRHIVNNIAIDRKRSWRLFYFFSTRNRCCWRQSPMVVSLIAEGCNDAFPVTATGVFKRRKIGSTDRTFKNIICGSF